MLQSMSAGSALVAAAEARLTAYATADRAASQPASQAAYWSRRMTPAIEGQLAADGSPSRRPSVQVTRSRFLVREVRPATAWKNDDTMLAEHVKSATYGPQRVRTGCGTSVAGC
jgi:hypothetical protein